MSVVPAATIDRENNRIREAQNAQQHLFSLVGVIDRAGNTIACAKVVRLLPRPLSLDNLDTFTPPTVRGLSRAAVGSLLQRFMCGLECGD